MRAQEFITEGAGQKPIIIYTNNRGATIDDDIKKSLPVTQISFDQLRQWESYKSMKDPKVADWVNNKLLPELKQNGILKPLLVWNNNGEFFVIDGNHRFIAYQEAGYRGRVPVQIVPDSMITVSDTVPGQQGMAEGTEQINEYRNRMYQYLKSIVPTWPDYIVKDWLYANFARGATQGPGWSFDTTGKDIPNILKDMGLSVDTKWQLVPDMKFTMNMWEPKTLKRLQARAGGNSKSADPDVHIPARDAERHATQAALAQQQGGVRKEPVIIIKTSQGYELLEGWHRTIQHFAMYPNGYTGPAYVAVASAVQENFHDGRNPGRKGLAKRSGVNTKASVSSLRKTAKNSSGEKQRMAHWLANMKAGRAKAKRK